MTDNESPCTGIYYNDDTKSWIVSIKDVTFTIYKVFKDDKKYSKFKAVEYLLKHFHKEGMLSTTLKSLEFFLSYIGGENTTIGRSELGWDDMSELETDNQEENNLAKDKDNAIKQNVSSTDDKDTAIKQNVSSTDTEPEPESSTETEITLTYNEIIDKFGKGKKLNSEKAVKCILNKYIHYNERTP